MSCVNLNMAQHPVTLNVATIKYNEWLKRLDVAKFAQGERVYSRLTKSGRRDNLAHFMRLMLGDTNNLRDFETASKIRRCEKEAGWLDAMDFLFEQLASGRFNAKIGKIVSSWVAHIISISAFCVQFGTRILHTLFSCV